MPRKKLEKSLKKYLTNEFCCVTLIKLPEKTGEQISRKKLEKLLKKYLTREKFGDIIIKLSAGAGSDWTLKIEQRKTRSHASKHDSTKN